MDTTKYAIVLTHESFRLYIYGNTLQTMCIIIILTLSIPHSIRLLLVEVSAGTGTWRKYYNNM